VLLWVQQKHLHPTVCPSLATGPAEGIKSSGSRQRDNAPGEPHRAPESNKVHSAGETWPSASLVTSAQNWVLQVGMDDIIYSRRKPMLQMLHVWCVLPLQVLNMAAFERKGWNQTRRLCGEVNRCCKVATFVFRWMIQS